MIRSELLAANGADHGFGGRTGGVSRGVYASANAGFGSGDDPAAVRENRRRFAAQLGTTPERLCTLRQVHGRDALLVQSPEQAARPGDAAVSGTSGLLLAVVTADCVPILLCDAVAGVAAAVHAGWRGAVAGVVEAAVAGMLALGARRERVVAALGPCIRPASYEIDVPFREAVLAAHPDAGAWFATGARPGHWQFDLAGFVSDRLQAEGIAAIEDLGVDTLAEGATYFSNRRSRQRGEVGYGVQLSGIVVPSPTPGA